jgi:Coenzyme PQQ synthesis protein D (PqqD)
MLYLASREVPFIKGEPYRLTPLLPENVEIGDSVIFQKVNDELVVLDLASQNYFGLDDVGARMWNLLADDGNLESAVSRLRSIYAADEVTLRGDLYALVRRLIDSNLLKAAVIAEMNLAG